MKIIEIKPDRSFKIYIGGREVNTSDIGLSNMAAHTYLNVKIILNTVKQARLCGDKIVHHKTGAKKFRYMSF